ncbi:hypothetical protein ACA910_016497 [Epithemia clementina (nom. ined.)]
MRKDSLRYCLQTILCLKQLRPRGSKSVSDWRGVVAFEQPSKQAYQRIDNSAFLKKSSSGMESDHVESDNNGVNLDGSTGEGGGQILRNAISYATILQKKLSIEQIRAKRSKPGLQAQHVASIQLPVQLCGGTLTGDVVGSSSITYIPPPDVGFVQQSFVTKDIGTAGSICLLLQSSLPCALLLNASPYQDKEEEDTNPPTRLTLIGGTNAALAPQYDYWHDIFLPVLRQQCGLDEDQVNGSVECRGYFPRGGGKVHVSVKPLAPTQSFQPIRMSERGDVQSIHIRSFHAGKLPRHLAQDMARAAQRYLEQHGLWQQPLAGKPSNVACTVEIVTETHAAGSGLGILIVATTTTGCKLAGSALSSPRKKANDVGLEAAQELIRAWDAGGCVDEWLQDQLILYMALADGVSELLTGCLTLHTQTAIWTAEQFLKDYNDNHQGPLFEVQKLDVNEEESKDDSRSNQNQPFKKQKQSTSSHFEGTGNGCSIDQDLNYGQEGLIPGRHLIRCHGVGFKRKGRPKSTQL